MNQKLKLRIYMLSFGRSERALKSLKNIRHQIQMLDSSLQLQFKVEVFLSVNSDDSYNVENFAEVTDMVYNYQINLGADINIGLGFSESITNHWDFLCIIGADEPVGENAIELILQTISSGDPDLIVGSKSALDRILKVQSFQNFNREFSGTLTFISSCIFRRNFSKEIIEKCLEFSFTSYSHVCLQNLLYQQRKLHKVVPVEMQLICDYHYKVLQDPLKPRSVHGCRDSKIFFGKILTPLVTNDQKYIESEFAKWWKLDWHGFSIYSHIDDFQAGLVFRYLRRFPGLYPWLLLSLIPYWRAKEVLRPVTTSRISH